jgi:hypothetical protein
MTLKFEKIGYWSEIKIDIIMKKILQSNCVRRPTKIAGIKYLNAFRNLITRDGCSGSSTTKGKTLGNRKPYKYHNPYSIAIKSA